MSHGGRSEDILHLRRLIAALEEGGAESEAAGAPAPCALPLGREPDFWLDAVLGGGLRRGAIYEVAPGAPGDQAAAGGFALGLALCFARADRGALIWVGEEFAWRERGAPYGPGLRAWGLDPARLILTRASEIQGALWALEEALRCRACAAVLGEFWSSERRYDEASARRLALAARAGGVPCVLLHSGAAGAAASPGAQARFAVFSAPAAPAGPRFTVQVLKARASGGRAVALDPEARRAVVWRSEAGAFEDDGPRRAPDVRPARRVQAGSSRLT